MASPLAGQELRGLVLERGTDAPIELARVAVVGADRNDLAVPGDRGMVEDIAQPRELGLEAFGSQRRAAPMPQKISQMKRNCSLIQKSLPSMSCWSTSRGMISAGSPVPAQ